VKLTGGIRSGSQGNGDWLTAQALREWAERKGLRVHELPCGEVEVIWEAEGDYEIGPDKIVRKRGEGEGT